MRTSLPSLGLNTRRTIMRPLTEADLRNLINLHTDPTTKQYAWVDNLQTPDENLDWIKHQQYLYQKGFGLYAIESGSENQFIGICGLRVRNDLNRAVDIAYRILPQFRLMGYATEAAKAFLHYGFENLHLHEIIAQVHRNNHASRRIMYRLGFEPENTRKNWILYRRNSESQI